MQEVFGLLPPSSPELVQSAHPALPPPLPLCVLGRSQETLKEQRLVGTQHLLCVTLSLALGTFSSSPEAQKRTRQIKPFTHHPCIYHLHPTRKKKKVKQKQKKNLLYRDIFLLYKVCTVPKKDRKKRCTFFFIIVGKWCGSLFCKCNKMYKYGFQKASLL